MSGKSPGATMQDLSRLAADQHGVVSRRQMSRLGLGKGRIEHLIRAGHLHRVFRGVYASGHPAIGQRGRMRAATLACGDAAVVSHRSAAALLGLLDRAPVVIDVISRGQRGCGVDGIRAHWSPDLGRAETGSVQGIPCTSPARTLVDLCGMVGQRSLRSAFERAAAKKMLDLDAVEASLASRRRRGTASLRALTDEWREAASLANRSRLKSPLEAMVLPILSSRGIVAPRANVPVDLVDGHIEVDFLWAEQRFVLEADSRDFHGTEVAFERDRWRDRELLRVGFSTLRVTRRQAESEAEQIADAICRQLAGSEASVSAQRRAIS
jgi:predicted transcriptional regulator of viral defense system